MIEAKGSRRFVLREAGAAAGAAGLAPIAAACNVFQEPEAQTLDLANLAANPSAYKDVFVAVHGYYEVKDPTYTNPRFIVYDTRLHTSPDENSPSIPIHEETYRLDIHPLNSFVHVTVKGKINREPNAASEYYFEVFRKQEDQK